MKFFVALLVTALFQSCVSGHSSLMLRGLSPAQAGIQENPLRVEVMPETRGPLKDQIATTATLTLTFLRHTAARWRVVCLVAIVLVACACAFLIQRVWNGKSKCKFRCAGGPSCGVCGLRVGVHEAEKDKGKHFHKECFRCAGCSRTLRGVPFKPLDGGLYCDEAGVHGRGGRSCYRKRMDSDKSADAIKSSLSQRMNEKEKALTATAKEYAIDVIGDELEDLVSNMAPKCAVCSAPFAASDELVCQGMVKIHKDCIGGGPSKRREITMTASKACNMTPGTLLLKLQVADRVLTFLLAKEASANKRALMVMWRPDTRSRTPNSRSCRWSELQGKTVRTRAVGELGADLAEPVVAATGQCGKLSAAFVWTRHGLKWDLRAEFQHDSKKDILAAVSATLKVCNA